jgi:hypothetical protein
MLEALTTGSQMRCRDCTRSVKQLLEEWREQFLVALTDGRVLFQEWASLQQWLQQRHLSIDEATYFIQEDALSLLERLFARATEDGHLEENAEQSIRWFLRELRLTTAAPRIVQQVEYLSKLRKIRQGQIPTIKPTIVLPTDELCYLETPTAYRKLNKSGPVNLPGRLIVTNKRIIFAAHSGGGEVPLNKVLKVTWSPTGIFLELSRQANNGFYAVNQSQLVAEIILVTMRITSRQLVTSTGRDTRHIPQHVRAAVFQRDGARCVQCGAREYLELDHIIPLSKGGATSVNNLQILCRRCNSQKRDKI